MTRNDRQKQSVSLINRDNNNIILNYVPRFGKTKTVIKAIANGNYNEIFIVAPNDLLKRHWEENIRSDYSISNLPISITVETARRVASKNDILFCDLLVIDEIHKYLTPDLKAILNNEIVISKKIIGLTGTMPVKKEDLNYLKAIFPLTDVITEEQAILNNWISNYTEYNLGVSFPDRQKDRYASLSDTITKVLEIFKKTHLLITYNNGQGKVFKDDLALIYACLRGITLNSKYIPGEKIRDTLARKKGWTKSISLKDDAYSENIDIYWNPNSIKDNALAFTNAIRARNKLLSESWIKLDTAVEICKKFNAPTIIFSESSKFADDLELNIEKHYPGKSCIYHSALESRYMYDVEGNLITYKNGRVKKFGKAALKKLAVEGLKTGVYTFLSTVKSLDEGFDIPNLTNAIITSGTVNPLQQQQRSARVKTLDLMNTSKSPRVINIFFKDFIINGNLIKSRDLTKLLERQKVNSFEPVWINSVDEII